MSPTQLPVIPGTYLPSSDALQRHEYGIVKHKKTPSTGGGRAWSEEEELYLLQTRHQKMPYKHIAARLKKTELACRLHYHQLCHSTSRRKRSVSVSSVLSDQTPLVPTLASHAGGNMAMGHAKSRSLSPPSSVDSCYDGSSNRMMVQLPGLMGSGPGHVNQGRLPTILPKPVSMIMNDRMSPSPAELQMQSHDYQHHHRLPSVPERPAMMSSPFSRESSLVPSHQNMMFGSSHHQQQQHQHPMLQLDCSGNIAPPSMSTVSHNSSHVDMPRLHAVYSAHRQSFWTAIASDYTVAGGHHQAHTTPPPATLEQAWKTGRCCTGPSTGSPVTPAESPKMGTIHEFGNQHGGQGQGQDKTSIPSILTGGVGPRTHGDRDMVRRIEGDRFPPMVPI